jgi:hypothetical protein
MSCEGKEAASETNGVGRRSLLHGESSAKYKLCLGDKLIQHKLHPMIIKNRGSAVGIVTCYLLYNYTQTNLGLRNTALGNLIHVQHSNARTLAVEACA